MPSKCQGSKKKIAAPRLSSESQRQYFQLQRDTDLERIIVNAKQANTKQISRKKQISDKEGLKRINFYKGTVCCVRTDR